MKSAGAPQQTAVSLASIVFQLASVFVSPVQCLGMDRATAMEWPNITDEYPLSTDIPAPLRATTLAQKK